jgi:transposase
MTKRNLDWILIDALAQGKTQREAAALADVTERTVQRRREEPEFNAQVEQRQRQLRDEVQQRVVEELALSTKIAVQSLAHVAATSTNDHARVKAAGVVLEHAAPLVERDEHPVRTTAGSDAVERLRRRLEGMQHSGTVQKRTKPDNIGQNDRA